MISEAKNIYLCPSEVKDKYILRFAVCAKSSTQKDIEYSWQEIRRLGDQVLAECKETKFHKSISQAASNLIRKSYFTSSAVMSSNSSSNSGSSVTTVANGASALERSVASEQISFEQVAVKMNGKMHLPLAYTNNRDVGAVALPRLNDLTTAYTNLLEAAGEDITREGLLKTPERAAKAFQFFTDGYHKDLKSRLSPFTPSLGHTNKL